ASGRAAVGDAVRKAQSPPGKPGGLLLWVRRRAKERNDSVVPLRGYGVSGVAEARSAFDVGRVDGGGVIGVRGSWERNGSAVPLRSSSAHKNTGDLCGLRFEGNIKVQQTDSAPATAHGAEAKGGTT